MQDFSKIENCKVVAVEPTRTGTSKAGNAYTVKTAVFALPTDNEDYPRTLVVETMNAEVIAQLEGMKEGDAVAAIYIDPTARQYNGRWFNSIRLWRIDEQAAPERAPYVTEGPRITVNQAPAKKPNAVDTVAQLFDAQPVQRKTAAPAPQTDDLPF